MAIRPFNFLEGELRLEELKGFRCNRDVQGPLKVSCQIQTEGFEKRSLHRDGAPVVRAIGSCARGDLVAPLDNAFDLLPVLIWYQILHLIETLAASGTRCLSGLQNQLEVLQRHPVPKPHRPTSPEILDAAYGL